jgi:hypothetical protein
MSNLFAHAGWVELVAVEVGVIDEIGGAGVISLFPEIFKVVAVA